MFPKYDKAAYTPMSFVPLGVPTKDKKGMEHWRLSDDDGQLGDWFTEVSIFAGGEGDNFQKFIVDRYDAAGDLIDASTYPGPVEALVRAVSKAANDKVDTSRNGWYVRYLKGSDGKGAALSWPKVHGVIQGVAYANKGKDFEQPVEDAKLFIPGSCVSKIQDVLEERDEQGQWCYGNPVDPDAATKIHVFTQGTRGDKPADADDDDDVEELAAAENKPKGGRRERKDGAKAIQGYDVVVERLLSKKGNPVRLPRKADGTLVWADRVLPWNRVLRFLTVEEQFKRLCIAYRGSPDIFEYAFSDPSNDYYDLWKEYAPKPTKAGKPASRPAAAAKPVVEAPAAGLVSDDDDDALAASGGEQPEAPETPEKAGGSAAPAHEPDDEDSLAPAVPGAPTGAEEHQEETARSAAPAPLPPAAPRARNFGSALERVKGMRGTTNQ